jgi:hypothetical protein
MLTGVVQAGPSSLPISKHIGASKKKKKGGQGDGIFGYFVAHVVASLRLLGLLKHLVMR